MHRELTRKAKDRSPEGRGSLLEHLTLAVLGTGQATTRELELFYEIAQRLLKEVDLPARIQFAERMSETDDVPVALLREIAADVVAVAGPVLRLAGGFDEAALIDLSETLSQGHLAELADRDQLTVLVTDILVRRGDIAVLRRLCLNGSSEMSGPSIRAMIEAADGDDELCRGLASRTDLPLEDSERIVQRVALMLRDRMARRPAAAPKVVAAEPEPEHADEEEAGTRPAGRQKVAKRADINVLIAQVRAHAISLDDVVAQLAEEDRSNDIAVAFAKLCDLDEMAIMKVLVRKEGDGIAMVAKALDLTSETWGALVEFRRRRLKLSDSEARFERKDYALRSAAEARATLAQFQTKRAAAR